MTNIFEKRCADCAEMCVVKGQMTCQECFGQKCAGVDDCPLGVTAEEVESASKVDKEYKLCAQAEGKAPRKPRERKPNEDKRALVEVMTKALEEAGCALTVDNPEREFSFEYKGTRYRVTMAVPRK